METTKKSTQEAVGALLSLLRSDSSDDIRLGIKMAFKSNLMFEVLDHFNRQLTNANKGFYKHWTIKRDVHKGEWCVELLSDRWSIWISKSIYVVEMEDFEVYVNNIKNRSGLIIDLKEDYETGE